MTYEFKFCCFLILVISTNIIIKMTHFVKHFFLLSVILTLIYPASGCNLVNSSQDENDLHDDNGKPGLPDNAVLITTAFGQGEGIWTFNPQTLEVQDTLTTGTSWSINFSPDYRTVYSAWWDSNTDISKTYAIDVETNNIIKNQEIWNPNVKLDWTGTRLISMGGNPGIQVLDAQTFEVLHEGHTDFRNLTVKMATSPVKDEFYALVNKEGKSGIFGLMVFDAQNYSVKSVIPLTNDENRRTNMQGSYIDISPDGRYIYATVFNWQGGGGYGTFHVIDLKEGKQVFEALCGALAWLAVSPDGRHVYISDSAGTAFSYGGISHEFDPTNQILRYDVQQKQVDIFASGGSDFGLTDSHNDVLITSSIVVAPDSRSMYIRILSAGKTDEGISPGIIHVDTRTRELLNAYSQSPDSDGFVRSWLHQLKIGFRPD